MCTVEAGAGNKVHSVFRGLFSLRRLGRWLHGDPPQIQAVGFDSVEAFVADAVRHIDSIWLPTKTSQLVILRSEERGKAVFIELKPAEFGDYYTVNTAFPVSEGYARGKEKRAGWRELWSREPVPASTPGGQSDFASAPLKAGEMPSMDRGQSSVPSVANPDAEGSTLRISDDQTLSGTGKILSIPRKNPPRGRVCHQSSS